MLFAVVVVTDRRSVQRRTLSGFADALQGTVAIEAGSAFPVGKLSRYLAPSQATGYALTDNGVLHVGEAATWLSVHLEQTMIDEFACRFGGKRRWWRREHLLLLGVENIGDYKQT